MSEPSSGRLRDPGIGDGARLSVLAYDGMDDLDFFGAWSVLNKAQECAKAQPEDGRIRSTVLAIDPSPAVASGMMLGIRHHAGTDGAAPHALIVPGGSGAVAAAARPEIQTRLRALRDAGTHFYTVCSGCLLLASSGLLEGMEVAMHAAKHALLANARCAAVRTGLHRDRWLTSIGGRRATSIKSVEIAFRVLEDFGPGHVAALRKRMEVDSAYG